MMSYELLTESDSLLEEDHDSETFTTNVERLNKARRLRYIQIMASLAGLLILVAIIRYLATFHRKNSPVFKEPIVISLPPELFHEYGSERVQIKYGPFNVRGSGVNNGMEDFMIEDTKLPCNGCLITWMQAGLEFPDGSNADAATGMWLHHTLLINTGSPAVKSCKPSPERFFASGNERTIVDLTLNGTEKSGYWLEKSDKIVMKTELMNELKDPQPAYATITYEYIPYRPTGFKTVKSIWLDAGECTDSEIPVPDRKSFDLAMPPWTSTIKGRILSIVSHLHDGGVNIDIGKDGETVCRSISTYGNASEHQHPMPGMDKTHISFMSTCYDVGRIQDGEEWTLKAHYDLDAHPPMLDGNGKPDGVMGIAVLYLIED